MGSNTSLQINDEERHMSVMSNSSTSVQQLSHSTSLQHYGRLGALSESTRHNLQNVVALFVDRTASVSGASSSIVSPNISPLLLSSDIGISSLINVLCGGSWGIHDPIIQLNQEKEKRFSIRPRVLGITHTILSNESKSKIIVDSSSSSSSSKKELEHKKYYDFTLMDYNSVSSGLSIEEFKCPICLDIFDRPVTTSCRHIFCVECIISSLIRQSICPLCRSPVYVHTLRSLAETMSDSTLNLIYHQYLHLIIQCPKCQWVSQMNNWESHIKNNDCKLYMSCTLNTEAVSSSSSPSLIYQYNHPLRKRKKNHKNRGGLLKRLLKSNKQRVQPNNIQDKDNRMNPVQVSVTNNTDASDVSPSSSSSCTSQINEYVFSDITSNIVQNDESALFDSNEHPVESLTRRNELEISANVEEPYTTNSSADALACWLIDTCPGDIIKLYVISHRMENVMGAIGGIFYSGIYHAQAVIEFDNTAESFSQEFNLCEGHNKHSVLHDTDKLLNNDSIILPYKKTFLSMELFANTIGIQWKIYDIFPPLKATAQQIAIHHCEPSISATYLVEFLLLCRHKPYHLIHWNCQRLISDLKKVLDIPIRPTSIHLLPRPISYSLELIGFINQLLVEGNIPILQHSLTRRENDPNCIPLLPITSQKDTIGDTQLYHTTYPGLQSSLGQRWKYHLQCLIPKMIRKRHLDHKLIHSCTTESDIPVQYALNHSMLTTDVVPFNPPQVRIRSVMICLFPCEDQHRASLRPAARLRGLFTRTFGRRDRPLTSSSLESQNLPMEAMSSISCLEDNPSYYSFNSEHDHVQNDSNRDITNNFVLKSNDNIHVLSYNRQSLQNIQTDPLHLNNIHMENLLNDEHIQLRYQTLPILLFQIQSLFTNEHMQGLNGDSITINTENQAGLEWKTLGYLSVEFRSDCGLWWHVYNEIPPGLNQTPELGGTNIVFSTQTLFSLQTLKDCLESIQDREYHPTEWSGWDFVETILQTCCPSVAHHLLFFPVAEQLLQCS